MSGHTSGASVRLRRLAIVFAATLAGVGTAVLVSVAIARTFTLSVARNASVTNFMSHVTTHESIVVDSARLAVYTLSGDSKAHPKCTKANSCFQFWPPVRVSSARRLSNALGIKGRLGTWRRNGFIQVTLNGHPLYTFSMDRRGHATGEGIVGFKGTWHVIKTSAGSTSMTMTTGTTTTSPYPPPVY
jgi:predicted lipoprotein with Yx(FWY)xxD motif